MTFDHLLSDMYDQNDNAEVISVISERNDFDIMDQKNYPNQLPVLPLRNTVLFPGVVFPITVGRDKSIKIINKAYKGNRTIAVFTQKDQDTEDPQVSDLHRIGTVAKILKVLKMPDGNITAIIQGKNKIELTSVVEEEPFLICNVKYILEKPYPRDKETKAFVSSVKDIAAQIVELSPQLPSEANIALKNISDHSFLLSFISSNLQIDQNEKQKLLEIEDFKERCETVLGHLNKELQMLELKNKIQSKVKVDIDQQQREYFLHQQMRAIQEELGHNTPEGDLSSLRERASKMKWDAKVQEAFNKELDRLSRMNPSMPDYSVGLNYVELLLELPWNKFSKDNFDLKRAKKVLDADHFGMEKIKNRILEYLAVLKLKGNMKSPILCLYGPPGVGKTSLGKSIAKAMGREYVRMSLGGLHDESELRGHRKTYIGAMPGRIIQNLKKAGTSNPVFVLDEIDKIGNDFRGDPSSALLEVLDPEQNNAFHDNYVDLDYDLSNVLFVATANRLDTIQPALRDRMEIIELSGYSVEEKIGIAARHLLPKQRLEHGLKGPQVKLNDAILEKVITEYTSESGVRTLDKRIAKICRNQAKNVVFGEKINPNLSASDVEAILGNDRIEKEAYENNEIAGVVTGLAWTSVGGEILFVESNLNKGKGKVTLTGQLGDVMKESAVIASSWLKANAEYFDINPLWFDHYDIHIHFPAGAIPKDGPSAGVTILTSLTSLFTQKRVKKNLAMTGEVTLRGKVLPVGGIKEKILAAKRAGIKEIILCKANEKDIKDIEPEYLTGLSFHYVEDMMDVLKMSITDEDVKNPKKWELPEVRKEAIV
jgi:ATP-dependent Lon protease